MLCLTSDWVMIYVKFVYATYILFWRMSLAILFWWSFMCFTNLNTTTLFPIPVFEGVLLKFMVLGRWAFQIYFWMKLHCSVSHISCCRELPFFYCNAELQWHHWTQEDLTDLILAVVDKREKLAHTLTKAFYIFDPVSKKHLTIKSPNDVLGCVWT